MMDRVELTFARPMDVTVTPPNGLWSIHPDNAPPFGVTGQVWSAPTVLRLSFPLAVDPANIVCVTYAGPDPGLRDAALNLWPAFGPTCGIQCPV